LVQNIFKKKKEEFTAGEICENISFSKYCKENPCLKFSSAAYILEIYLTFIYGRRIILMNRVFPPPTRELLCGKYPPWGI
jgi:hypothetical protein